MHKKQAGLPEFKAPPYPVGLYESVTVLRVFSVCRTARRGRRLWSHAVPIIPYPSTLIRTGVIHVIALEALSESLHIPIYLVNSRILPSAYGRASESSYPGADRNRLKSSSASFCLPRFSNAIARFNSASLSMGYMLSAIV